jgi:hypothetical protein
MKNDERTMNPTATPTRTEVNAAIETIKAIADTIRELGQVPAGTLYAHLMSRMSLEQFEKIIGVLVNAGLVRRDQTHMLHWVG